MFRFLSALLVIISVYFCLTARASITFDTDIQWDSDELSYLVAPEGVRNRIKDQDPKGELNGRVLHAHRDFNNDGVADLGIFELQGESLRKLHYSYQVHFGVPGPDRNILFSENVDARIDSEGIPFDIHLQDYDDDGHLDICLMAVNPGFFKTVGMMFSAIFGKSITLNLDLYRMTIDGYPPDPTAKGKIRTVSLGKSGEPAAIFPAISCRDIDQPDNE